MLQIAAAAVRWEGEGDAQAKAWVEQLHVAVVDDATGIGYINMLADGRPPQSSWTRLACAR